MEFSMYSKETVKSLGTLYIRVSHIMDNAIKKEMRRKGIVPKIGALLYEIYRLNNPSPLELAHVLDRKPQTITAIIHRMKQEGLVKKEINPKKKIRIKSS
jgi:DNA-binding MarR family transcriptional regulator